MIKKILCLASLLSFVLISVAFAADDVPKITAEGAIVIEATTGRVVYEKNADKRLMPASTTKIMTAILTLENSRMTDAVLISTNAANTEDQNLPIEIGDKVDVENLLKGMLIESDNGSSVALAEHFAGNTKRFASLMNKKANDIGCENTNFITPNGLPDKSHLSTARDMAKISAYAMKIPKFREIVSFKNSNIFWVSPKNKTLPLENTNRLLWTFEGATGIKTGWTSDAGGCLAASAKRNGIELIVVVLKSEDSTTRFKEAEELLEYGFKKIKLRKGAVKETLKRAIWVKDGVQYKINVMPRENLIYPMIDGDNLADYSTEYAIPKILIAPVKKGDKIGEIKLKYKGDEVGKIDVLSTMDVDKGFSVLSYFAVGLMYYFGVR